MHVVRSCGDLIVYAFVDGECMPGGVVQVPGGMFRVPGGMFRGLNTVFLQSCWRFKILF